MSAVNSKISQALFPLLAAALLATGCSDSTAPSIEEDSAAASPQAPLPGGATASLGDTTAASPAPKPAFAVSPTCLATSVASGQQTIATYFWGYGPVTYRVWLSGTAKDRCGHGDLRGKVGVDKSVIMAKDRNGGLKVNVFYRLSGSSTWRVRPLVNANYWVDMYGGRNFYPAGGHVDLYSTQRITHVKVVTQVLVGGLVSLPRRTVCSFLTRTCVTELGS